MPVCAGGAVVYMSVCKVVLLYSELFRHAVVNLSVHCFRPVYLSAQVVLLYTCLSVQMLLLQFTYVFMHVFLISFYTDAAAFYLSNVCTVGAFVYPSVCIFSTVLCLFHYLYSWCFCIPICLYI